MTVFLWACNWISDFVFSLLFDLFKIMDTDPWFAVMLLWILMIDFLIFSSILVGRRFKVFFIFWAVVIGISLLGMFGSAGHCSGEQCLGNAILFGLSFMLLVPNLFNPLLSLLCFKLFKVDKFWKAIVATLVFGCVVFGFFYGLKVLIGDEKSLVVQEAESSVSAPIVKGIKEETAVKEEAESEENVAEEQATEPEVKKLTQDEEIALIEKYYGLLEDGKLEDAYAMKFEPKESLKTFEGWYGNVTSANPHDFTKTGDSRYQFLVDLGEGAGDGCYQVIMEIVEGKLLKTISSKELSSSVNALEEKIYNSGLKAYVKALGENSMEIHLVRNDVDVLAYSITDEDFASIESLNFSNSGRYLMYRVIYGYEWNSIAVYDTIELKKVHEVFAPQYVGFTSDEKNFYECQGMGMMGGYIEIYTVPAFGLRDDLTPNWETQLAVEGTCVYDSSNNTLKYKIMNLKEGTNIEHVYAF